MNQNKQRKSPLICKCNEVDEKTIKDAIQGGCKTLNEIFDKTNAGVGPCGGSCRRTLGPLLEYYLKHGSFPPTLHKDNSKK